MIYIVSGDGPRCGSAMAMRCLEAGGIPLVFDPACDEPAAEQARAGYHPNAQGLCELPIEVLMAPGFPEREVYDGKAVKIFPPPWGPLTHLPKGEYKVLWLHRQARARWRSLSEFYVNGALPLLTGPNTQAITSLKDMAAQASLYYVGYQRDDMEVICTSYDSLVEKPRQVLEALVEHGWPLDAEKAAQVPDVKFRRF